MTDASWDEGPVAALLARIQEAEAARDRAVAAVRELRAALKPFLAPGGVVLYTESALVNDDPVPFSPYSVGDFRFAQSALAATASYEEGP